MTIQPSKQYTNNSTVRTFAILEIMSQAGYPLTLANIGEATKLDVTTIRRFIMTLCDMGYVKRTEEGKFKMTSKILDLSSSYLRNVSLPEKALPLLSEFCQVTKASVSLGILDGTDVVYVAHVSEKEALSVGVRIGTRLPAHATAIGKVLLSTLADDKVIEMYGQEELSTYTTRTISKVSMLLGVLNEVRNQEFAISEEEYESGVRAASCPIMDTEGRFISAINVSARTKDVSKEEFYTQIVPALLQTSYKITDVLK